MRYKALTGMAKFLSIIYFPLMTIKLKLFKPDKSLFIQNYNYATLHRVLLEQKKSV